MIDADRPDRELVEDFQKSKLKVSEFCNLLSFVLVAMQKDYCVKGTVKLRVQTAKRNRVKQSNILQTTANALQCLTVRLFPDFIRL